MDHGSYFTCRWFFRVADTVCVEHDFLFFLFPIQHVFKQKISGYLTEGADG
jgi:hypothetical protein